jgi:AraC family transcriptional regulator of adaptative response / methylphosphotriester-DNA alkyltransferase methyltransferase
MNEAVWKAIVECDPSFDGQFYYGLVTTGIFCRPSCKSKTPKREHVKIFETPEQAIQAGLRPCKRCRPEEPAWRSAEEELVKKLLAVIDSSYGEPLTLHEMAERLFVSPFYLQRCFKRVMNISPGKYLLQKRIEQAKRLLAETNESITEIALQVGFRNSSHFTTVFQRETRFKPTRYRKLVARRHERGDLYGLLPVGNWSDGDKRNG